jgi:hypothetical protein
VISQAELVERLVATAGAGRTRCALPTRATRGCGAAGSRPSSPFSPFSEALAEELEPQRGAREVDIVRRTSAPDGPQATAT